jgi:hypothetical protein
LLQRTGKRTDVNPAAAREDAEPFMPASRKQQRRA